MPLCSGPAVPHCVLSKARPLGAGLALLPALLLPLPWAATARAEGQHAYDRENAQEILETCAGCHGKDAQGGGDGEYPRLAGMPERYIARQLRAFKSRTRINIPMYQYATERELPEPDVLDIARLISGLELITQMPDLPAETSAYQRLLIAGRVFNIRRAEGDVERGRELFEDTCEECHGEQGFGDEDEATPPLAGQYTEYLRRQIGLYRSGERKHEDMEEVVAELTDAEFDDVFAWLSTRDD
jgi:cytochrome c553